jgi:ATP-dependent RNA helicase DeaD
MGFTEATEIQQSLIPLILEGRDVIGQARTGTGKTAAFGLPMLQSFSPQHGLQGLVVAPTRELTVQVASELERMAEHTDLHIVPVYGGERVRRQLHALGKKPHVVVGTPGRLIDFMKRGALNFEDLRIAVLDEVDRMLDIGFRDDIKYILSKIEGDHQTVFVSATLNDDILQLARRHTTDPVEINVSQDQLTVDHVTQTCCTAERHEKFDLLTALIKEKQPDLAIVFCNTRRAVHQLSRRLHGAGLNARGLHGDMMQQKRTRVMERFRRQKINLLVATDLAARGIDVQGITHIINYDIPADPDVYVHRIGRTARMGQFGEAITIVTREEGKELTAIEKLINREIPNQRVPGFESKAPESNQHETAAQSASENAKEPAAPQSRLQRGRRMGRSGRRRRR